MHSAVDLERELVRFTRTARRAGRRTADLLSPGLDASGYALLVATDRLGTAHACELADLLGVDKSTVSRALASLVDRGLVERTADPVDRRAQVVALSAHGRERLQAARAEHSADLARVLADWSPADLDSAVRVVSRLSDGLAAVERARSTSTSSDHQPDQIQEPSPA